MARIGTGIAPPSVKAWIVTGLLILIIVMTALPVFGVFGNTTEFWGPLPMTLSWTYLWYAGVNVVGILIFVWLFRPWSHKVIDYLVENDDAKETWLEVQADERKMSGEDAT